MHVNIYEPRCRIFFQESSVVRAISHTLSCERNVDQNDVDLAVHKCKDKIRKLDSRPIREIYDKCFCPLKNKGIDLVAKVPSLKSLKSALYKVKNETADVPKMCFSKVNEVEIPKSHLDFVMCDYLNVHETEKPSPRIIIFCLNENKGILSAIKHIFCDGTFQCCPPPFDQLYVMHGDVGSSQSTTNVVPLLYALLSDRKTETYDLFCKLVSSQIDNFCPKKITMDMEQAAVNAFKKNFPDAEIKLCYFHVKRNIRKKGKKLNLLKNKFTSRVVMLCGAMPLLPTEYMTEGWNYILKNILSMSKDYPNMLKLVNYMKYWLKNDDTRKMMSVFSERHRTNNCCESWNSGLLKMIGRKRPNILQLLNALKRDSEQKRRQPKKIRKVDQIATDKFIQETQMELISSDISVGHFLDIVK